jgi:hypothetical protein
MEARVKSLDDSATGLPEASVFAMDGANPGVLSRILVDDLTRPIL